MERINKEMLQAQLVNVNHVLANRSSRCRYTVQARNGYTVIERTYVGSEGQEFITAGTKREISNWLSAALTGMVDANCR